MEILQQIQSDLLDEDIALSSILRKAKVLATQLGSDELGKWVSQELDGYASDEDLPDYRTIHTGCVGKWTNGYWLVSQHGVPMNRIAHEGLKKYLTAFPVLSGIRSVEQYAIGKDQHFVLPADITSSVNSYVATDGYGYMEIEYAVGTHSFQQILDTVRNRLLDFVLKVDQSWSVQKSPPPKEKVNNLVSVLIHNNPEAPRMTMFDQRGQQVQYQYNAAGDINIDQATNKDSLADELEKLKQEVELARASNAIDGDIATETEYHLLQAMKEARKERPEKASFLKHVTSAKELLGDVAAVAGVVTSLVKAAEIAASIFR